MSQLSGSLKDKKKKKKKKKKQSKAACPPDLDLSTLIGIDIEKVPKYLFKSDESLEQTIGPLLSTITKTDLHELRYIAILMHRIILLEMIHGLWITYRNSGMGQLPSTSQGNHQNKKIWPTEIRSFIRQKEMKDSNEDEACLTLVNKCLQKLDDKGQEYRKELQSRTSTLRYYTPILGQAMEKYVQQQLLYQRLEYDRQDAMIHYHYTDRLLKDQYLALDPNEEQVRLSNEGSIDFYYYWVQ